MPSRRALRSALLLAAPALALGLFARQPAPAAPPPPSAKTIQFNRDIRPILSETCFTCHGPDKNARKGKFRLDDRDSAVKKKAIVPGHPEQSEAVKRLFTTDPDDQMPPPDSGKKITPAQKELLRQWIAAGAEYQPHWAYVTPTRPEIPSVKESNWVRTPVDAFILQQLDARNIKPSPEADRRTLLRRLSLDLIGLPPTAAEVEAFVNDKSPDAYEKQVKRLLASPHYGERMAVPWLDLARFADTVGYHGDQNQRIFPYRDYVINAFNSNKPFDQFTVEQIAGDLLPNATVEQRIASGFNRLNMVTREGGAQPGEYLAKYTADRVRTVSSTFLGSTMGCCECHDHKFDPFSAKDFYSLGAFFADIKQWGVYMDYGYTPNPDLRGFSNDHPFPTEIQVDSPYLHQRQAKLQKQINTIVTASAANRDNEAFTAWCKATEEFLTNNPTGWSTPPATPFSRDPRALSAVEGKGSATAVPQPDGSILFPGKAKKGDDQQITLTLPAGYVSAIRLEVLPHSTHGGGLTRDGGRRAESAGINLAAAHRPKSTNRDARLSIYFADADHKETRYANGFDILGVHTGWRTDARVKAPQSAVYLLDKPFKAAEGDKLVINVKSDNVGCVRLAVSPLAAEKPLAVPEVAAALQPILHAHDRTPEQRATLDKAYFLATASDTNAFAQYKPLFREVLECRDGKAWTMVTESKTPMLQRVLPRGNWQDESGEIVAPNVPHFLPQPPNPDHHRLNRLDLAKWIVSPENPLTARTFVNRLWKQFYGNALSAVVDDLGAQGEAPTHPELLDYLAVEFRESGWNVKHMVELMVCSSTYRQSSSLRPELHDVDPNNRLLASQNPRRLEAEFVRDNALAISGLIDLDLGGPSAHPYQPPGYYANIQFPNRDYYPESDDRQYRRGLYTHWQRTFLHPMLANFDAPSREECTASRIVSNTPQQALTLLNDPSFVEAAKVFAAKLLSSDNKSDAARITLAYQDALGRAPNSKEAQSLLKFLAEQRAYYTAHPDDAKKLTNTGQAPSPTNLETPEHAAWTTLCRVVLNLHETITRY
jgi:hypothetical protein